MSTYKSEAFQAKMLSTYRLTESINITSPPRCMTEKLSFKAAEGLLL